MKNNENIEIPEGLEERLSTLIDALAAEEAKPEPKPRPHWFRTVISAAACLTLVAAIGMGFNHEEANVREITEPHEAQVEVERAMLAFATALDKGMEQAEAAESQFAQLRDILNNTK